MPFWLNFFVSNTRIYIRRHLLCKHQINGNVQKYRSDWFCSKSILILSKLPRIHSKKYWFSSKSVHYGLQETLWSEGSSLSCVLCFANQTKRGSGRRVLGPLWVEPRFHVILEVIITVLSRDALSRTLLKSSVTRMIDSQKNTIFFQWKKDRSNLNYPKKPRTNRKWL